MSSTPDGRLRLKILSDPANLAGVRQAVENLCAQNGFEQRACDEIGLCVNEAMANVIRHAYHGATDKPIEVAVDASEDEVKVGIRDWGTGVDPRVFPVAPKDPLTPGGLGMICLRQLMDHVEFLPQPDGGMLLEMTRRKQLHA